MTQKKKEKGVAHCSLTHIPRWLPSHAQERDPIDSGARR